MFKNRQNINNKYSTKRRHIIGIYAPQFLTMNGKFPFEK